MNKQNRTAISNTRSRLSYLAIVLAGFFFCTFVAYEVYGHFFSPILDLGQGYRKDLMYVYYLDEIVEEAHPRTFQILENDFACDKKHLFYKDKVINFANPNSFRVLSNRYALDSEHVYFFHTPIPEADPSTFEVIYDDYTRDGNHIFLRGEILVDIDPETFVILDVEHNIIRDKDRAYQDGREITIDPEFPYGFKRWGGFHYFDGYKLGLLEQPFEELGGWFIRDEKGVYYKNEQLQDVNTQTFAVIDADTGRDDTKVFYKQYVLRGANPNTIQILGDSMYAWDGRNAYYLAIQETSYEYLNEIREKGISPFLMNGEEFEILGRGYVSDKRRIFYGDTDLGIYDPSFHLVEGESWDAQTDTAYFREGNRIDRVIRNWKLTSSPLFSSCEELRYEGVQKLRGWYAYVRDYVSYSWAFVLSADSYDDLPGEIQNFYPDYFSEGDYAIVLSDVDSATEKELKKSSEKKPLSIEISSFSTYCEGLPRAEIAKFEE